MKQSEKNPKRVILKKDEVMCLEIEGPEITREKRLVGKKPKRRKKQRKKRQTAL